MSAFTIQDCVGNLETSWWEMSHTSSFMSVCLDFVWSSLNGGDAFFQRAQWKSVRLHKGPTRFVNLVGFEIWVKPQWFWQQSPPLHSFLQNSQNLFFFSFVASCSWQLFDTVNDHSRYWKPSATNNLHC